jgi:hypothetical protein
LTEIIKKEGFGTLYTGLSAGILRQITYTSSRMGIFKCAPVQPSLSLCSSDCAASAGGHTAARWTGSHAAAHPQKTASSLRQRNPDPLNCPAPAPPTSTLSDKLKEANQGKPIPLWQKAGAGAFPAPRLRVHSYGSCSGHHFAFSRPLTMLSWQVLLLAGWAPSLAAPRI